MGEKRLAGKVAVITGSGRKKGLGEAIARKLAQEGAHIVLSDIGRARDAATSAEHVGEQSEMEQIADELRGLGAQVTTCACDVRSPNEVKALADHAVATFGKLDIWVNNAGIGYIMKPLLEVTEADWDAVIDVNLGGVVNGLDPVLKAMIARGRGHVAVTASVAGYRGLPQAAAYSATKAALIAMCESLALDLMDLGVRISVVNPGFVETEATSVNEFEMPFLMQPDDAARRIVEGLARPGFEIAFPLPFVLFLRAVGLLPNQLYFKAWRRLTR